MSKGPTPRHSKPPKPVTIDLDATDVTPKDIPPASKPSPTGPSVAASKDAAPDKTTSATDAKSQDAKSGADTGAAAKAADAKSDVSKTDAPKEASKPTPGAEAAKPSSPKPAESKPAAKPAAPAQKSGGGIGWIAAGVAGAVIALGGGYALQMGGLLPVPGGGDDQVASLSSRIDSVSSTVDALSGQVAEAAGDGNAAVAAQLSARIDGLETALAAGGGAADPSALQGLEERLSGIESEIAALGASAGSGGPDPELAATVSGLSAAQAALQTSLAELKAATDALAGRIAGLEQAQGDLSERLAEPGRQIDLARAIAAAGLKSAIDRGTSFMSELEAFASVAPDDPAVPELRDLAARGVPSRSQLIERFPEAADKVIAAANPGDPDAGLVDRLMSSAMSVVKVRQVGDVEGDSAEAIAARAEARLMDGDIDAALAEWNALPEASRAAAAEYGDALAARARAEKLIAAAMAPAN